MKVPMIMVSMILLTGYANQASANEDCLRFDVDGFCISNLMTGADSDMDGVTDPWDICPGSVPDPTAGLRPNRWAAVSALSRLWR